MSGSKSSLFNLMDSYISKVGLSLEFACAKHVTYFLIGKYQKYTSILILYTL